MKQARATEAPRIVVPSRDIYGEFVRIITTEVLEQISGVAPEGLRSFRADEVGAGVEEVRRKIMCHHCLLITPNAC
jgi:hypothetical protein